MTASDTFRADTRAWLEANCPPEMREPVRNENDACWGGRNFRSIRARPRSSGWSGWRSAAGPCPTGPAAYGGGGLSPAETKILRRSWRGSARATRFTASASRCSARRC